MKTILPRTVLIVFLAASSALHAQNRNEILFPDIPGFTTLKCDFHVHTCFSDATPWPADRVTEAWMEGLDAIALTDHIEYRPNQEHVNGDLNRPWDIALATAGKYDIILIKGGEITRHMPPGHLNAIFLEDVNLLKKDDFMEAIAAAVQQDAFIFWNHPGWKEQAADTPKWYPIHTQLLEKGWLHGIEIVNWMEYYPEVYQWALDRNLTLLGNSDIHEPSAFTRARLPGWHRPLTLVFARDRSSDGIREALKEGRTAVWFNQQLFTKEAYALQLVQGALKKSQEIIMLNAKNEGSLILSNTSDLELRMKVAAKQTWLTVPEQIIIPPRQTVVVPVSSKELPACGTWQADLSCRLENVFTVPGKNLEIDLSLSIFSLNAVRLTLTEGRYFLDAGKTDPFELRYTTDGSVPVKGDRKVTDPLPSGKYLLNCRMWDQDYGKDPLFRKEVAVHKLTGNIPRLTNLPEERYTGGGPKALTDGFLGTDDFKSGHWMGFFSDLEASFDFPAEIPVDSAEVRFMKKEVSWIFKPDDVFLDISLDGNSYSRIPPTVTRQEGDIISYRFVLPRATVVRSIRLTALHPGLCPQGHPGEGKPAWMFVDEFILH